MISLRKTEHLVFFLACGFLMLSGCTKDNNQSENSVEISSSIALAADNSDSTDPESKSTVDNDDLLGVQFEFARAEVIGRNDISASENSFTAVCTGYTNEEKTIGKLKFTPRQFYYPDGRTSKLQGWYPSTGSYDIDEFGPYIEFTFDGQTDIMVSDIGEGEQIDKGLDRLYTFHHVLTQLQFKVKAATPIAATQWGTIKSITIDGENNEYSLGLFEGDSNTSNDYGGPGDFDGPRNGTTFETVLPQNGVKVDDENWSDAGILLVEPREISGRRSFEITITAENSSGETRTGYITIDDKTDFTGTDIENEGFKEGYAYALQLELQQDDVVFTLVPAKWKSVEQEVEVGENQPYVRGSDNYIISRNMFGDATGWTVRDGDWSATENNVPAILEVATTDAQQGVKWDTAKCPDGWHLPTEQELKLIWTYQSQLSKEGHKSLAGEYWSCFKDKDGSGYYYSVNMDADSYTATKTPPTGSKNVRCVRDIKMSID